MNSKIILIVIIVLGLIGMAYGANCWDYSSDSECTTAGCSWKSDQSGGGWCEELDCWSFWTSSECSNSFNVYNLSCTWKQGTSSSGWCSEISCNLFEGTNQTACETGSQVQGLSCEWSGTDGDYNCMGGQQCSNKNTESSCENISGCRWGMCWDKGCWSYSDSSTCNAQSTCSWNSNTNNCEEINCWSSKFNTANACENASDNQLCRWNSDYGGYCEDLSCGSFNNNQTGCLSPGNGLDCEWDSFSNSCMEKGCWSYWDESSCDGKVANGKNCTWQTDTMANSGWCEKVGCWNFDNMTVVRDGLESTNESYCVNNSYGLSCVYDPNGGWCFQNVSSMSCASLTDQKACWDTMYCFWDFESETCDDPSGDFQGGSIGGSGGGGDFKAPPCGIFYLNETNCNATIGCGYDNSLNGTAKCQNINPSIASNGLNCTLLNDSSLCNSAAFMPHCCEWQGGSCTENKFSTSCWDNIPTPPSGAGYCEDTNAYDSESNCNKIANYPWYMPCVWNNATGKKKCEFANSLFSQNLNDDEKGDLDLIDNKMACEKGGGGTWVTESYCGIGNFSNISITAGRCVSKSGTSGGNCNLRCGNCEYTSTGLNHSSAGAAKTACENSELGICEWTTDTNAENGYGYCKPKKEFKSGAVSKCTSTNCDACNNYQSAQAQDKCIEAACKWEVDPLDFTKGTCMDKNEKSCNDDCASCKEQEACSSKGRGGPSESNDYTSPCTWDTTYGICKSASTGSNTNSEICFNGIDDDNDGNIDCADSGCFTDSFCGGDSMVNCFQYNNNDTCMATDECYWFNDTFGGWCDMKSAICWQSDGDEAACNALNDTCVWHTPPPGQSSMCMMNDNVQDQCMQLNDSTCTLNSNCTWFVDQWCVDNPGSCGDNPGWCGPKYEICWNNQTINSDPTACNNANDTVGVACSWQTDMDGGFGWCEPPCGSLGNNCASDPLCSGKSGFCDPKGFGGGGSEMFDCWQYDNDATKCDNQTQCSWMVEPIPFCDMMMGVDCGQFGNNKTSCNLNGNCTWINETDMGMGGSGAWCGIAFDQCSMNQTLQQNATLCNSNSNCNYSVSRNSCEPSMFVEGSQDAASCQSSGGLWRTGWCNPAGMAGMFTGMEMHSPPTPLGNDECGEAGIPAYSDICFAGIKDEPDTWGLGIGVSNIAGAAMCNNVKTAQGIGNGQNTVKFYWYMDTDGSTTGGCALPSNSSSVGWDVFLQYVARYTEGSLTETTTAKRCVNNNWIVTNIELNTWKEKMCNEMQGGMVALSKDDLSQFEGLLDITSNMRFYIATANGSTNSSIPLDTLGPVYYTSGSMDFMTECCWAQSDSNIDCDLDGLSPANDPDCDFMSDGFVKFEDCWGNGIDEDEDGYVDCADSDCKGNTYCVNNQLGVEAAGYVDTVAPKVLFYQIERYPDSALLNFDSNEPTNGTVYFYRNDSRCASTNLNATLYDVGIFNDNTPNFKNWHEVDIYQGTNSLDYSLLANTSYFYKFEVCDESGNCAKSACSNFTTSSSIVNCQKCNFIFNMDVPTGWTLDLDIDGDNTYETLLHRQCGSQAGILMNYTDARSVNLKFTETETNTSLYFLGVRVTRSVIHDNNIRKVDSSGGIKAGTTTTSSGATVGYAGLSQDITNRLVDKLHPKSCRISIPGSGTCDSLYHCDDSLENCVDKTDDSTLNKTGADYCVWDIPCEFSTYAGGQPGTVSSSSTSPGGSSGGSGGGAGIAMTNIEFDNGRYVYEGGVGDSVRYMLGGDSHSVKIGDIKEKEVDLVIKSVVIQDTLKLKQTKLYDVDADGLDDIVVTLESITIDAVNGNKAKILMALIGAPPQEQAEVPTPIEEEIPQEAPEIPQEAPDYVEEETQKESSGTLWLTLPIIAALAVLLVIAFAVIRHKR